MVDKLLNAHAVLELDALLGDAFRKADSIPVDVAGEVRGREVTADICGDEAVDQTVGGVHKRWPKHPFEPHHSGVGTQAGIAVQSPLASAGSISPIFLLSTAYRSRPPSV